MIDIILQINTSEKNAMSKSVSTVKSVQGNIKNDTSIVDPVLTVSVPLADITGCNYLYVPQFGRKYFIKDIVAMNTGIVEITCHVDVLESFKTEILSNTAIISKSEKNYNMYLDDGSFKVYQNPNVVNVNFPNGFSAFTYVLAVAG